MKVQQGWLPPHEAELQAKLAADLVLERTQGGALTEAERSWHRDAFLEQVERRYRAEQEAADAS